MEYPPNKKLERIGAVVLVITLIPAVFFAVQAILVIAWLVLLTLAFHFPGGYEIKLADTGETFVVVQPAVLGGDGYQNYKIRHKGENTDYGLAESGEGSRRGADSETGFLCVWPAMSTGPEEGGCLFYFDPKTRQAYLTRPE